jgi:archaellum biogenesis ATPase FlaH
MKTYELSAFGHITSAKILVSNKLLLAELPDIESVKKLATWTQDMAELFVLEPSYFAVKPNGSKQDRSAAMMKLAYSGAENQWTDEQIMTVLLNADDRWGKYRGRRNRYALLLDMINRARQKHGYRPVTDIDFSALLKTGASKNDDTKLVYGWMDFLGADFHIDWMLEGLLAVGGFGFVTGYPGVGKTTFAIQLGAHIATGAEGFLKWDAQGGAKKVLFLSLEMGPNPLALFWHTVNLSYLEHQEILQRNFNIFPLGNPIGLDTKEGQAFLSNLLDEYMPDLIIIDSLQAVTNADLSDSVAAKAIMAYFSQIRTKYRTAVLIVHHNRKKNADQQQAGVEISDTYGSVFLTANVDFVLTLHELSKNIIVVTHAKNRLGPKHDPFEIVRDTDAPLTFSLDFEHIQENFQPYDFFKENHENPLSI